MTHPLERDFGQPWTTDDLERLPDDGLVVKRHEYAAAGIPLYWIVDPVERAMYVLELDGDSDREAETVRPGDAWRTTRRFPISLDLADVV